MNAQPLSGVRVLDFTRVLAGPYCTMLLGDLGADIIKVEETARGDETREWGPPWVGSEDERISAYYLCANRNKRSLTLNLKHAQGREIARQLALHSHVVIENFKPGTMDSFGLGYTDLAQAHPALVYCSITGFGQTGPYSERPGYDFIIQAMSGLMSITGPELGEPSKLGVAITDVIAGLFAANSILAALRHAEHTGQGQHLDVALLDSALAALVNVGSNALVSEQPSRRYGNAHPNIVPYEIFPASDGDFALGVGNDRQFNLLCNCLGLPQLAADPRFSSNPARVKHRQLLIPLLRQAFQERPAQEWVEMLNGLGIPCGMVNEVRSALQDPQVSARGLIQEVTLTNGSSAPVIGMPVQFSATPAVTHRPPPAHGEHTQAVLEELLELSAEEIQTLEALGVI